MARGHMGMARGHMDIVWASDGHCPWVRWVRWVIKWPSATMPAFGGLTWASDGHCPCNGHVTRHALSIEV